MKKLAKEDFIKKANLIHNNKYNYSLVNYVNVKTKIKIICPIHGEFEQIPNNHISGSGCLLCGVEDMKLKLSYSTDDFIRKAKEVHGEKYNYSQVNYLGMNKYVGLICPIHGKYYQFANSHLMGRGCAKCVGQEKTTDDFIRKAKEVHGEKYNYSQVNYINSKVKVEIICEKHGVFMQSPTGHLSGKGCPYCNESKGENKIACYLLKNSIEFIRENKFEECRGKKFLLPFDFYLPKYNTLIEFDGRQHYDVVNFNGSSYKDAKKAFLELKNNDRIKNEFAKKNNYHLLRIKYCDYNKINNILSSYEPIS